MQLPEREESINRGSLAELRLNGKRVGTVEVRGTSDSWSWGYFQAEPSFAEFAPLFGTWSLIMHADEDSDRLTRAAADELRRVEMQMDALRGELFWLSEQRITRAGQINIDDTLVEWKHE